MFNERFLKIVAIITGVLVAGEALALLVGMVVLSPHPNPWISPRNIFWFGLDIVCGASLKGVSSSVGAMEVLTT